MGSGKSTCGRGLAERSGRGFVDIDEVVEKRERRLIARIFAEDGEAHFRQVEAAALHELDGGGNLVVATGGGLFLQAAPRRWMKSRGPTVWLDVPLEVCAARVGEGRDRPLWLPRDPLAARAFFDRRRAAYALAEMRLEAGGEPADRLVGRLMGLFD
jgi:shikimate kinase